jgi:hypothetical protein
MKTMALAGTIFAAAICPSAAMAASLTKAMNKEPEFEIVVPASLADIERCLVMSTFDDLPNVYRAANEPKRSLVYYMNLGATPVILLEQLGPSLSIRIWNDKRDRLENNASACIGASQDLIGNGVPITSDKGQETVQDARRE